MIDDIISDFAKRIGILELAFNEQGIIQLDMKENGMLFIEKQEEDRKEELLVYLARKFDAYDSHMPKKLLEFCSFDKGHIPALYGSIVDDNLILGLRFGEDEIYSGAELENSIYYLNEKFRALV